MADIKYRLTLQSVIRNTSLFGYGVGKAGYAVEGNITTDKSSTDPIFNFNIDIKKDSIYWNLVDSKNFLFDPMAREGLKDSTFVIEILVKRKEDVESQYGISLDEVSCSVPEWLKDDSKKMKEEEKVFELCVLYEIWDISKQKRMILIDGYSKEVFKFDWPYGLDTYPYSVNVFNKAPESPYGISDVSLYRAQQEEINSIRSMMAEHVKRNSCKWQGVLAGLEKKEVEKFLENETGSLIEVKTSGAISPIQPHEMSMDFSMYQANCVNDIKETLGIADFMRGGQDKQKGNKTAAQANSEDFFARLRLGDRQATINEFVIDSGDKLFRIMQNEYDTPRFVRIAENGQYISKEYTKQEIMGEYDLIIQQGTGVKMAQIQNVIMGLKMSLGNPLISPKEWTDILIDECFDGLDTSKLMIPDAEEQVKDPIKREQFRQIMLSVAGLNNLKASSAAIQGSQPGGQPQGSVPVAPPPAPPMAGSING
jgi:hypothetical protein